MSDVGSIVTDRGIQMPEEVFEDNMFECGIVTD